jgi:hypothetical protein
VNFAQYTAGGLATGTNVRTSFQRLRIDPEKLLVDVSDLTYSASSGTLTHPGGPTVVKSIATR